MILKEITDLIEENFPKELAYDWDNPGLLLGDFSRDIKKVMVTLDVTYDVLSETVKEHCGLIIAHHPLIFQGIKKINSEDSIGKILLKASEEKIAIYAAHTNMDTAPFGINKHLAELFSLSDCEIIEKNPDFENAGLGFIGNIEPVFLEEFAKRVKSLLNTPFVRVCGERNQIIKRVAIGSGSCSELIPKALKMGADTIITGDLKYHTCLDYSGKSFSIIDAGHFPTEQIATDIFINILSKTDLQVVKSSQTDVFTAY